MGMFWAEPELLRAACACAVSDSQSVDQTGQVI